MISYIWQFGLTLLVATPLYLLYKSFDSWTKTSIYLDKPNTQEALALRQKLTINAFERLTLLCERIQPDKLAQRLQSPTFDAKALSQAMIVAIQQEFDHNITQQIYVSDSLWSIISISKDEALFEILEADKTISSDAPSHLLTEYLMQQHSESKLNVALTALRTEAKKYIHV